MILEAASLLVLPALLLASLVLGRYPGEAVIQRLRKRRPRRHRAPRAEALPRLPLVVRPVGHLIAAALAVRPPPARGVTLHHP